MSDVQSGGGEATEKGVTFHLNGKEVTVKAGSTVMEAATGQGVAIPHFCWHPGLSIAGVCRFCMVKVEGRPKLEIACNLPVTEGMNVITNDTEVKDAHKWALEFHLINHPLDCPICDQAGECKLQDFYMEVGKYKSQMERPKVLKPKALDVGEDLVLDTERCILCSRCVRFEEEVTKTTALGIFSRGDRSIIGTYPGKRISHNYQTNLVDICPVGAFTSKDFRFKQRVWFLKDKPSICPGCSTGCHVDVFAKEETRTFFRLKPRESPVNGHWMCDKGRDMYLHLQPAERLRKAYLNDLGQQALGDSNAAITALASKMMDVETEDIALLVSSFYTNEEYNALFAFFVEKLGVRKIYQWRDPKEQRDDFDGILWRGDHSPNTFGLTQELKKVGIDRPVANEFDQIPSCGAKIIIALAPEVSTNFSSLGEDLSRLEEMEYVSVWTLWSKITEYKGVNNAIPMKGFAEKAGTFMNHSGVSGTLTPFAAVNENALDVAEVVARLSRVMSNAASYP